MSYSIQDSDFKEIEIDTHLFEWIDTARGGGEEPWFIVPKCQREKGDTDITVQEKQSWAGQNNRYSLQPCTGHVNVNKWSPLRLLYVFSRIERSKKYFFFLLHEDINELFKWAISLNDIYMWKHTENCIEFRYRNSLISWCSLQDVIKCLLLKFSVITHTVFCSSTCECLKNMQICAVLNA